MKLRPKLQAIQIPAIKTPKREAERLFAAAVKVEQPLIDAAIRTKNLLVESCLNFFEAKFAFAHGEWESHCALYEKQISIRTIQRRVEYAREWLIPYVILKSPDMKVFSMREVRARAAKMEIPSTTEMNLTFRDCGVAIEFGQYYPEDYKKKKTARLLSQGEFDFGATVQTLGVLCKRGLPMEINKAEQLAKNARLVADHAEQHLRELKNTIES